MNLLFWGLTLGTIGKVMLALGVLMAHSQLEHEHRIDERVIRTFHKERTITLVGLALIVIGYAIEISFYGFTTSLLACHGPECQAAVGGLFLP
mgnify:CR=1 FL=1